MFFHLIKRYLQFPGKIFAYVFKKLPFVKLLNDKQYISILYFLNFGKKISFSNPVSFNEKMQWLKLYDRKDIYTTMVDKYDAKKYVANIIGDNYVIPTLGIYDSFDEIDFNKLPEQFVIKCTHDSGGLVIVKDKEHIFEITSIIPISFLVYSSCLS